jgi:hypothetical protein
MINFGITPNIILGLVMIICGSIFYSIRTSKKEIQGSNDIFLTTLNLIYAGIMIIHGWRLDPILLFSQITIAIIVGFTTVENIQLREQLNIGVKRKKYRRRTKIRQM